MDQKKMVFGIAILLVLALGLASYFFSRSEPAVEIVPDEALPGFSSQSQEEKPKPENAESQVETATFFLEEGVESEEKVVPLPSLDESDSLVRQELGSLTHHPVAARTSGVSHLVRKAVTAADLMYRNQNPFSQLFFFQPDGAVQVDREADQIFLSENNYSRYEGLVTALESLDERKVLRFYQFFLPLIGEAYDELAYPDMSWKTTLDGALDSIISAPEIDGRVEVIGEHGVYMFAQEELEALPPLQKLMIRMGPDNARRVKEKVKGMRRILDR